MKVASSIWKSPIYSICKKIKDLFLRRFVVSSLLYQGQGLHLNCIEINQCSVLNHEVLNWPLGEVKGHLMQHNLTSRCLVLCVRMTMSDPICQPDLAHGLN